MSTTETADAVVIGGGFYGASIATYLRQERELPHVVLLEREPALLSRASVNNQARVHNGYHYPRSFTTAYRSRVNLPRFMQDWPDAITTNFTKIYAIARRNSKVNARQFKQFCRQIGASAVEADAALRGLFNPHFVEAVYLAEEPAFDASVLRELSQTALTQAAVDVRLSHTVTGIRRRDDGLSVTAVSGAGEEQTIHCRYLFNCTYSSLNQFSGDFSGTRAKLKHEITEMALVELPEELQHLGVTVMDGPFFSLMPYPSRNLHTLSHVRFTPHTQWPDTPGQDPRQRLQDYPKDSRCDRMIRDAARLLPAVQQARQKDSLFEIKTVLQSNESDDGRPILFEKAENLPGCYSILGGKIDNIYDIVERLDKEPIQA